MLQDKLGDDYSIKLAMRYQNPSIPDVMKEFQKENIDRLVVFPMFPQYASASSGSAIQEVMDVISNWLTIIPVSFISSYHDHPKMIEVYADNARKWGLSNYDHVLFSFHGIPQQQLTKSDCNNYCLKDKDCCQTLHDKNKMCYSAQCYHTAFAIADNLDQKKGRV